MHQTKVSAIVQAVNGFENKGRLGSVVNRRVAVRAFTCDPAVLRNLHSPPATSRPRGPGSRYRKAMNASWDCYTALGVHFEACTRKWT